jgi:carboxypeptidase Q
VTAIRPMRQAWRTPLRAIAGSAALAALALLHVSAQESDKLDADAVARIRDEGMQRSQVMEIMSYLTDVYGPRLTGSPNTRAAGEWTVQRMKAWGINNPRFESWGPFGRGWTNERFSAQVVAPRPYEVIAYPSAWSPATKGPASGEVVVVQIDSATDFATYRGKLRGKWVFVGRPVNVSAHFDAQGRRYTQHELDSIADYQVTPAGQQGGRGGRGGGRGNFAGVQELNRLRTQFFVDEGALGTVTPGRGDGGTVFTNNGMSREKNAPPAVPGVIMSSEHYGRIVRSVEKGVPVVLEINMQNRFYDNDLNSFNIVGEIPGTDPRLRDELVMLGAHFDSWHAGTGATDNAAGSAVMLEALRILKTLNLPMKRTVRIGLWTGEEQGLLGSRAYVRDHFGTSDSLGAHFKPEQAKVSGYFNVDNGTGQIRGVYQQGNAEVAPIFAQWMAPFKDWGVGALTMRNTGGTDHLSFDAVDIPGFQFIQDPIEYGTRTHHSNQDVYERIQDEDMNRNAVIVATFVYGTANRDAKLPRKPVPVSRVTP